MSQQEIEVSHPTRMSVVCGYRSKRTKKKCESHVVLRSSIDPNLWHGECDKRGAKRVMKKPG